MNLSNYKYQADGNVTYMDRPLKTYLMTKNGHVYAQTAHGCKPLHRLVWMLHHGTITHKEYIIPKNGDWMDTRIENLEKKSPAVNRLGKVRADFEHLVGCHFDIKTEKWAARKTVSGKQIFLGYFDTEQEAHKAYLEAK